MIYWEDVEIGLRRELGSYTFSEEEIVRFARKYDPQPFHIDAQAAQRSIFGGLIASGWHTAAIWMKLAIADRARTRGASPLMRAGVSPGYEDMRWMRPVRPGMTLTYTSEIVGKVELRSRRDVAIILSRNEARDEKGELVFRFTGKGLVQRRPIDERPIEERNET
jgi:acyl dehydratase